MVGGSFFIWANVNPPDNIIAEEIGALSKGTVDKKLDSFLFLHIISKAESNGNNRNALGD